MVRCSTPPGAPGPPRRRTGTGFPAPTARRSSRTTMTPSRTRWGPISPPSQVSHPPPHPPVELTSRTTTTPSLTLPDPPSADLSRTIVCTLLC
eukprot:966855-Prorocentrum_minimum.AAC.4